MGTRITDEIVYEYWDCMRCGVRGIRGDHTVCPACGHERVLGTKFYRGKDESVGSRDTRDYFTVTPPCLDPMVNDHFESREQAENAKAMMAASSPVKRYQPGTSGNAEFLNLVNDTMRALDEGKSDAPEEDPCPLPTKEDLSDLNAGFERMRLQASAGQIVSGVKAAEKVFRQQALHRLRTLFILAAIICPLGFLSVWLFSTHHVAYRVASATWERRIEFDRYVQLLAECWADEKREGENPTDVESSQRIRRYDHRKVGSHQELFWTTIQVRDGTEEKCTESYEPIKDKKGNATGRARKVKDCQDVPVYKAQKVRRWRDVPDYQDFPIYAARVKYRAWHYEAVAPIVATGSGPAPEWPALEAEDTVARPRPDRITGRVELNFVNLDKVSASDSGPDKVTITTAFDRWSTVYRPGNEVTFSVNGLGHIQPAAGDEVQ